MQAAYRDIHAYRGTPPKQPSSASTSIILQISRGHEMITSGKHSPFSAYRVLTINNILIHLVTLATPRARGNDQGCQSSCH